MAREAPWKPNRTVVSLTENRILDVRTPKRRRHQPPRKVEATTALQCPERNPRSLRHPPSAETRSATRVSAEIRLRTEIRPPTQIPPPPTVPGVAGLRIKFSAAWAIGGVDLTVGPSRYSRSPGTVKVVSRR